MKKEFLAVTGDAGMRLDVFLKEKLPDYSRAFLQRKILAESILVNGKRTKPGFMLAPGDRIALDIQKPSSELEPNLLLDVPVLFENRELLVINKPAGMAVHPAAFPGKDTVANWLVARYPAVRDIGDSLLRPGILHRLDRWTSGVMVIAKTQGMFEYLKEIFKARRARKEYLALLEGRLPKREGGVEGYLAPGRKDFRKKVFQKLPLSRKAKLSRSRFRVMRYIDGVTLAKFFPETGRTHQIRVHAKHLGYPVLGDCVYGATCRFRGMPRCRFYLHARRLALPMPDGREASFSAPVPGDFRNILRALADTPTQ